MLLSSIAKITLLGRMKATTWIVSSCATLLLFTVTASVDICLLKEASVSEIRGQVNHLQESLVAIPASVEECVFETPNGRYVFRDIQLAE